MKNGNWIPVDKKIVSLIDGAKPYTEVEAYISLRVDLDNNIIKGMREYSRIWKWSTTKVFTYFTLIGYDQSNKKVTVKRTPYRIIINDLSKSKKTPKVTIKKHYYNTNIKDIVEYLNKKTGKTFKPGHTKTRQLINTRLTEGYTKEDFFKVIDIKCAEWLDNQEMSVFLRPETLFSNKFESYVNQKAKVEMFPL